MGGDNNEKLKNSENLNECAPSTSASSTYTTPSENSKEHVPSSSPVCLIVLGMAGSGKTTFVKTLTEKLYAKDMPPYVVNLDPACMEVPYPCHVGK